MTQEKMQEELERFIRSKMGDILPPDRNWMLTQLAEDIIDAGYVKLSDVGLDEEKIIEILRSKGSRYVGMPEETVTYFWDEIRELAHAIAQAKRIVRVKE